MRNKVVKIKWYNTQYEVVHDDKDKVNPYRVYGLWNDLTDHGIVKRRKQLVKYADLASCLFYLYDDVARNYTERG